MGQWWYKREGTTRQNERYGHYIRTSDIIYSILVECTRQ